MKLAATDLDPDPDPSRLQTCTATRSRHEGSKKRQRRQPVQADDPLPYGSQVHFGAKGTELLLTSLTDGNRDNATQLALIQPQL